MYKTHQEIFNMAYLGLAMQGWQKSDGEEGMCKYRSPLGLKCAIGHCIPDEKYDPTFDNGGEEFVPFEFVLKSANISKEDHGFCADLQICHDFANDAEDMQARLARFASNYKLFIPILGDHPNV